MSETTTPATEPTTPPPAPSPAVDVKKIQEDATNAAVDAARKAATEVSNERLKQVLKGLSGERDEPTVDPLAIELLKNPAKVLGDLKTAAKKEAKDEARKESSDTEALRKTTEKIATPFFDNTPGIKDHLDYVDALIVKALHDDDKMTYENACKLAFEETVKRLKIPTVSEAERNRRANSTAIPGMGGAGLPPNAASFDDQKSSDDFIKGLQSKTKSFKEKTK